MLNKMPARFTSIIYLQKKCFYIRLLYATKNNVYQRELASLDENFHYKTVS